MGDDPPTWSTACPDHEFRLLHGLPLVPDLPLFREEADRALRIFKRLRIPDVIGTPRMGDATGDWVFRIVEALFGSYDEETNRRLVQELFVLVPKKNSKSSTAAMIMLTAILVNRRPSAEFLLIAPTKGIADIAFKQISGAIKLDETLGDLFHCQQHIRTITHIGPLLGGEGDTISNASIVIKAADTDVITGSKSTGILIDETHVFAKKPKAADIFVEIRGALAARPDGFMIQITTQSKDPPTGVFKDELKIAREVRDGNLALPLLPVLYELPLELSKDGGWKQEKYWPLVNPNMNRSVDESFLRNELIKAERKDAGAIALLASQHFNVEIGLSLRSDRWAGADYWLSAADEALTLDEILDRSECVTVGIDGGGADDLLGVAVIGREIGTRRWLHWAHSWAHPVALERRKENITSYEQFETEGDMTIIEDYPEDLMGVIEVVERVKNLGLLGGVGVDTIGLAGVVEALADIEVTQENGLLFGIGQGYVLTGAIKGIERKLIDGSFIHCGSAMMNWSVGNAKVEPTKNAFLITKQASGLAKIDPLMATFDAAKVMERNPTAKRHISVYDQMGDDPLPPVVEDDEDYF